MAATDTSVSHWPLNLIEPVNRLQKPIAVGGLQLHIWTSASIGQGSCGTVFAGRLGNMKVAVKLYNSVLTRNQQEELNREVGPWETLDHRRILPFICKCDLGIQQVCLVSPYMENGNLMDFINKYPGERRLDLLQQAAEGLHYLHSSARIVHGDLKCTNILISADRNAYLADFGLSTFIQKAAGSNPTATYIRFRNTVQFAAPELFTAEAYAEPSSNPVRLIKRSKTTYTDSYAFGMLLYEAIAGVEPWSKVVHDEIPEKVKKGDRPERTPAFGEALWLLCCSCWSKEPFMRPDSEAILSEMTKLANASNPSSPV